MHLLRGKSLPAGWSGSPLASKSARGLCLAGACASLQLPPPPPGPQVAHGELQLVTRSLLGPGARFPQPQATSLFLDIAAFLLADFDPRASYI